MMMEGRDLVMQGGNSILQVKDQLQRLPRLQALFLPSANSPVGAACRLSQGNIYRYISLEHGQRLKWCGVFVHMP